MAYRYGRHTVFQIERSGFEKSDSGLGGFLL